MKNPTRCTLLLLSLLAMTANATAPAFSQYAPARDATIAAPPEGSLDTFLRSFYAAISGPRGHKRDGQALRAQWHPDVRFMFAERTPEGAVRLRAMGAEEFLAYTTPLWEEGFYESEVARQVVTYGRVAHAWSTYETRRTADGPVVGRGINSIQLFWDGERWQVATVYWQGERPQQPIPSEFLPRG